MEKNLMLDSRAGKIRRCKNVTKLGNQHVFGRSEIIGCFHPSQVAHLESLHNQVTVKTLQLRVAKLLKRSERKLAKNASCFTCTALNDNKTWQGLSRKNQWKCPLQTILDNQEWNAWCSEQTLNKIVPVLRTEEKYFEFGKTPRFDLYLYPFRV